MSDLGFMYCIVLSNSVHLTHPVPPPAPVISCDWMSEGKKLVSGSWDRTAKLWDFESSQVIHSLEGEDHL